jgi:hypothetical protein
MPKTYTKGPVTYGAAGRRWTFKTKNYQYSTPLMPGGRTTADKIAGAISGAAKRLGPAIGNGLDCLAKGQMHKIFHDAQPPVTVFVNR